MRTVRESVNSTRLYRTYSNRATHGRRIDGIRKQERKCGTTNPACSRSTIQTAHSECANDNIALQDKL